MSRLLVAVETECDHEALEILVDCLETRKVKVERLEQVNQRHIVNLSWIRRDSPKRQTCLTIEAWGEPPFPGMTDEQMVEAMIPTARMALTEDVTLEQLLGWRRDLRGLSMHAALCHEALGIQGPSGTGQNQGRAPSPWLPGRTLRTRPQDDMPDIVTLREDALLAILPDMPRISLFMEAKITRKGVSNILLKALTANSRHDDVPIAERMRLAGRYGEYRPPA